MPAPRALPLLSKSRFTAGLQCLKRLYLECYQPRLATPPDAGLQAIFDTGTAVGIIAQRLYPGGALVNEDYRHHDEAVARTAVLMANPGVPALFEAAFTQDGIRVRVDLLARDGDGWALVEVKSTARVKPEHLHDVAIQVWALEHAGVPIRHAFVAHLNTDYVYPGGEYEPHALFTRTDITAEVRERLATIPDDLAKMWLTLQEDVAPAIATGPHCTKPHECQFLAFCRESEGPPVEWPIEDLPNLRAERVRELRERGIQSIHDLPRREQLSALQERVRAAVLSGRPYIGDGLADALRELRPPVHFVDFETASPTLPLYPGTRPFQQLAFQWSDHVLHEDGRITHAEFLADGEADPREAFTISLAEQLRDAETVAVYSSFEATALRTLGRELPQLADTVGEILGRHRVDMHTLVKSHYYHPEFHGSFSLKSILPALVPEMSYDTMEIADGGTASRAFLELRNPGRPPAERAQIREALLAYCGQDTLALVRIAQALRAAAQH